MGIGSARAGSFVADSFGTGSRYGVYGQAYGTGNAWTFGSYGWARNSGTGTAFGGYFYASAAAGTGYRYGVFAYGPTYAGYFSGNTVTTGTKSAAVKTDNGEYRLLYSQESPENWFEDFGGGSLQNGGTTIQIDPLFAQTVNTQIEYRVYLTPEGDCRGLYVTNKTANSFEVRELQGGVSNTGFSYRIVAKRKGFENLRLAKIAGQTPEQMEFEQQRIQAESERESARRAKLENPESGPENLQIGEEQRIREENERMTAERLKMEKEREAEKSRMEKERVSMEVSR